MELETTTTIREKISWMEDQPIAWDKHQAWMRIERGGEREAPARRVGYYAAAAVLVMGVVLVMNESVSKKEGAGGMSNVERQISNVEVGAGGEVNCGTERVGSLLGARGVRRDRVPESSFVTSSIITPDVIEEQAEPFVLMPEPVEGQRIAIVENVKPVAAPVEKVRAIFGVEEQPSVAIIKQGKKLRIYFLQTEISQSSLVNIDESSSLEARINKK